VGLACFLSVEKTKNFNQSASRHLPPPAQAISYRRRLLLAGAPADLAPQKQNSRHEHRVLWESSTPPPPSALARLSWRTGMVVK